MRAVDQCLSKRDARGDARTNRHTPKHTLVHCRFKDIAGYNPPPHLPQSLYSASDDRGAREGQQMYLQANGHVGMHSSSPEHSQH